MSPWVRKVFLNILPRLLIMRRPNSEKTGPPKVIVRTCNGVEIRDSYGDVGRRISREMTYDNVHGNFMIPRPDTLTTNGPDSPETGPRIIYPDNLVKAMEGVRFVAEHLKIEDEEVKVR